MSEVAIICRAMPVFLASRYESKHAFSNNRFMLFISYYAFAAQNVKNLIVLVGMKGVPDAFGKTHN